jgi:hypothetical protein
MQATEFIFYLNGDFVPESEAKVSETTLSRAWTYWSSGLRQTGDLDQHR